MGGYLATRFWAKANSPLTIDIRMVGSPAVRQFANHEVRILKRALGHAAPTQHVKFTLMHMRSARFGRGNVDGIHSHFTGKRGFGAQFAVWGRAEDRMGQVRLPIVLK